jgi:hypothetical protein
MHADEAAWYHAVLHSAANQARTLLPTIQPLAELLLGTRPLNRKTVALRPLLERLAQRHGAALLPVTPPMPERDIYADEQIVALMLDQMIDDVARSGPNALPIRIETMVDDGMLTLRALRNAASPGHAAMPETAEPPALVHEMAGLGLRFAAAATRLLGGRIERHGTCCSHDATTLSLVAAASPAAFGTY